MLTQLKAVKVVQMALKMISFGLKDIIFISLLIVPGLVLLTTTGDITIYFDYNVLDGQFLYILSKFFGLYAIFFVCAQLLFGLYISLENKSNNKSEQKQLHRTFGVITLGFIVLHISLFVLAVSIRNGHFAYKLLLPNLLGNYYPFMVSLGVLAFVLIIFSVVSVLIYRKNNNVIYRWGHRLTLPAFILILVHSYTIGSETRIFAMQCIYILMLAGLTYFTSKILLNVSKMNL